MNTIKPKKGICIDCTDNKEKIVIKHGKELRCQYHHFRFKQSQKKKPEISEMDLFNEIWNERPHVSFISGRNLEAFKDTEFFPNLFAHVLSKAQNKYPKLKFNKDNIVLLHPMEHFAVDQGSSDVRAAYEKEYPEAKFEVFYELQERLKEEYQSIFSGRESNVFNSKFL